MNGSKVVSLLIFYQTSQDVAQFNIMAAMHEIIYGTKYQLPQNKSETENKKDHQELPKIQELNEDDEEDKQNVSSSTHEADEQQQVNQALFKCK